MKEVCRRYRGAAASPEAGVPGLLFVAAFPSVAAKGSRLTGQPENELIFRSKQQSEHCHGECVLTPSKRDWIEIREVARSVISRPQPALNMSSGRARCPASKPE